MGLCCCCGVYVFVTKAGGEWREREEKKEEKRKWRGENGTGNHSAKCNTTMVCTSKKK